jgi:hypothetical protein
MNSFPFIEMLVPSEILTPTSIPLNVQCSMSPPPPSIRIPVHRPRPGGEGSGLPFKGSTGRSVCGVVRAFPIANAVKDLVMASPQCSHKSAKSRSQ